MAIRQVFVPAVVALCQLEIHKIKCVQHAHYLSAPQVSYKIKSVKAGGKTTQDEKKTSSKERKYGFHTLW